MPEADVVVPEGYRSLLSLRDTERAIKFAREIFESNLAKCLNLQRVSAPIAVPACTGVNDYLNGVEKPVSFTASCADGEMQIVQSLAKWKRQALADYGFGPGEGLYTDMNAIRPDEKLDNLHSIYVDQWDWEKVIEPKDRNLDCLKSAARLVYKAIRETAETVTGAFAGLPETGLPHEIFFIHSEELEERYPGLPPWQREDEICREAGAVFVIGIGADLPSGAPHDGRAADYDDWSTENPGGTRGLNGDIVVHYPLLDRAFELSSMGIRVNAESLRRQLELHGEMEHASLEFHSRLLRGELPQSIGGGIGQSRLCMLLLGKAHIGEVQAGLWPPEIRTECLKHNIFLL